MSVPREVVIAAAKAHCIARFSYAGPYAADDGRDEHIRIDAATVAEEPSFLASLEAAALLIAKAERERIIAEIVRRGACEMRQVADLLRDPS